MLPLRMAKGIPRKELCPVVENDFGNKATKEYLNHRGTTIGVLRVIDAGLELSSFSGECSEPSLCPSLK